MMSAIHDIPARNSITTLNESTASFNLSQEFEDISKYIKLPPIFPSRGKTEVHNLAMYCNASDNEAE